MGMKMECKYFGICGSCRVYDVGYVEQLEIKRHNVSSLFHPYFSEKIPIFTSLTEHYRARAEFQIYHEEGHIHYAMQRLDRTGKVKIESCPMVSQAIYDLMPDLLKAIEAHGIEHRLFGIDFLSGGEDEVLVSLIYHKPLDEEWEKKAKALSAQLGIHLIGRSRKQKVVLNQDFVTESLNIHGRKYLYRHVENSFTQPNPGVNEKMIEWSLKRLEGIGGDLLELYCGAGNFTIPFASKFDRVLATEISKSSIYAAKENMKLNSVTNIDFVRLSAEEFTQALDGVRKFNRMEGIDIDSYHFKTLFVDPPRSGLGDEACAFASRFDHLLYISCNPETLCRDLSILEQTHEVVSMAGFDQFPYTHHLEMGAMLVRKGLK